MTYSNFIRIEEILPIDEFSNGDFNLKGYRHPKDLLNLMINFDRSKSSGDPGFILYRRYKSVTVVKDKTRIVWLDYRWRTFYTEIPDPEVGRLNKLKSIQNIRLEKLNKLRANERICESYNCDDWNSRKGKKKIRSRTRRKKHNHKKWYNRNFKQESLQKHQTLFHPDTSDNIEYSTWCMNCNYEFIHYHLNDNDQFSSSCVGCKYIRYHNPICYRINRRCRYCKCIDCECEYDNYSSDDYYY